MHDKWYSEIFAQVGSTGSEQYGRLSHNDDGRRETLEHQRRARLFDDNQPVKIQQQRRVQFDDEVISRAARHQHSLSADLSGTKYDIGMYGVGEKKPHCFWGLIAKLMRHCQIHCNCWGIDNLCKLYRQIIFNCNNMQIMHFIPDKILKLNMLPAFLSLFVAKLSDLKNSPFMTSGVFRGGMVWPPPTLVSTWIFGLSLHCFCKLCNFAIELVKSVSQSFRVCYLLKTAAKCTKTYHFEDKKFSGEVPSPLHHIPLPSTQWHIAPSLLKF